MPWKGWASVARHPVGQGCKLSFPPLEGEGVWPTGTKARAAALAAVGVGFQRIRALDEVSWTLYIGSFGTAQRLWHRAAAFEQESTHT